MWTTKLFLPFSQFLFLDQSVIFDAQYLQFCSSDFKKATWHSCLLDYLACIDYFFFFDSVLQFV